jgi:hypothetical protein
MALVTTDVSEEHVTSIIRVERISKLGISEDGILYSESPEKVNVCELAENCWGCGRGTVWEPKGSGTSAIGSCTRGLVKIKQTEKTQCVPQGIVNYVHP